MDLTGMFNEAGSVAFWENMKNATQIYGKQILTQQDTVSPAQNFYFCNLCCYAFAHAKYIEEIAKSLPTLDFLSLTAVGRSAIECYALAKFIYLNYNSDHAKLFQLLVSSELNETATIIGHYKKQIKTIPALKMQLDNNREIFRQELQIFPEAREWCETYSNEWEIVKAVRKKIKEDNFAPALCADGKLIVGRLVSLMLQSNRQFGNLYGNSLEAAVFYDLLCSFAHNNHFSITKLFAKPANSFKASLYPQQEEQHNARYLVKILYADFVDLIYCLRDVTERIRKDRV